MPSRLSRYCTGIIEATWLAAVAIIPIYFNIYSSRIFEPDKVVILRSLSLLALGAWLIKLIEDGGIRFDNRKKNISLVKAAWNMPMFVPVLGLFVVYIVATIFSISPGVSLWGSYQRLQGTYTTISYLIFFGVVVGNMRKWSQIDRAISTIIISSLPITLYGLLQRFGIDPIPWAGNTSSRIAANMGNSIFVAAYLIMVVPLTLGRIVKVFKNLVHSETRRVSQITQATIYIFIAFMQFVAIYLSQSRGPVMGLLAGGYFMALLLSLTSTRRWVSILVFALAFVGGGLLFGFNLENGPLHSLRSIPGIGRYGMLLDTESTTALSRKYIWKGAAELVGLHSPLKFPNGETDPNNFLRPLFGYGPESMYVAFNQFYPPELGRVEKRNASPDRSHNETWDTLIFTGLFGLGDYLLIFGSIYYYGVKWIGLVKTRRGTFLLILLMAIGGVSGSVGFFFWRGIEYLGLGLPFGILFGLLLYITISGLINKNRLINNINNKKGSLLLVMALSMMVAHFVEINFGIAIVTTRMLFWIMLGIMLVAGHILPSVEDNATLEAIAGRIDISVEGRKQPKIRSMVAHRRAEQSTKNSDVDEQSLVSGFSITGIIMGMILVTLGYDFLINSSQDTSISAILVKSFARLSYGDSTYSGGILGLCGITLLLGVLLFTTEYSSDKNISHWWKAFFRGLGISAGIWVFFLLVYAGKLASSAQSIPKNQNDVLNQVGQIGGLLVTFCIFVGVIIFAAAYFLMDHVPSRSKGSNTLGMIATPLFLSLIIIIIQLTNLRIVYADIAFKMADPFVKTNQWKMATLLYQRAIEYAPMEDHYYLFLGRSYLEQAKSAQTSQEQDALIKQAESDLKIAQRINPLNTDHTANLARLYNWWASRAHDSSTLLSRGNIASDYYQTAVMLSPNNMTIWGEWAILNIQILGKPQIAYDLLTRAIEIDGKYSFTQGLMGDYYSTLADAADDNQTKIEALEQAIIYYREAVEVHSSRDTTLKSTYLISLANAYIDLADLDDPQNFKQHYRSAIDALESAIDSDLGEYDLWRVQENIAQLYVLIGDKQSALQYAELALGGATKDYISRIQALILSIQEMP